MSTAAGDCTVRALRLRAPDASALRRGVVLLEDALRTASLPRAERGRVLVVRSLSLGRIAVSRSAPGIALVIEQRVRALDATAVWALSPGASAADAVFFRSETEPIVAFARLVARAEPARGWFWPRLFPTNRLGPGRGAALRRLLLDAAALREPLPALCAVAAEVALAGMAGELCAELAPGDAVRLAAGCGWRWVERQPDRFEEPVHGDAGASSPLLDLVTAAVTRWGSDDSRARFFAALALVDTRPSLVATSRLPACASRLARRVERRPLPSDPASPAGADCTPIGRHDIGRAERGHTAARDPAITKLAEHGRAHPHDYPTAFGGFYFLIQLLERLNISGTLAERPDLADADLPRHLLARAARALGVPAHDPVLAPLPESLRAAAPDEAMPRAEIDRWLRAMRRWAAIHPRRHLRGMVRRPARVAISRTHVDVTLTHATVDVAIRLAGLDIDPGWVPWLGRVVRFHYVDALAPAPAPPRRPGTELT